MSAEIIWGRFRERMIRPDMARVRKMLDAAPDDAGDLYVTVLVGIAAAEVGKQQDNHQALVDGLALPYFAIGRILGEAEDYLPPQAG